MSQHSKPMATQYSKVVCWGDVAILSLQSIWDKLQQLPGFQQLQQVDICDCTQSPSTGSTLIVSFLFDEFFVLLFYKMHSYNGAFMIDKIFLLLNKRTFNFITHNLYLPSFINTGPLLLLSVLNVIESASDRAF